MVRPPLRCRSWCRWFDSLSVVIRPATPPPAPMVRFPVRGDSIPPSPRRAHARRSPSQPGRDTKSCYMAFRPDKTMNWRSETFRSPSGHARRDPSNVSVQHPRMTLKNGALNSGQARAGPRRVPATTAVSTPCAYPALKEIWRQLHVFDARNPLATPPRTTWKRPLSGRGGTC